MINYINFLASQFIKKIFKLVKMKDIVNGKYIKAHQDEIFKLGDVIPYSMFKYISEEKLNQYFEYNTQNHEWFRDEIKTVDEWKKSEEIVSEIIFPEDTIQLLEEWVECYPQYEGVLSKENFDEYVENDGVLDHSQELTLIEKNFHKLIMHRAGHLIEKFDIEMPHITTELLKKTDDFSRESFPVPGMYGGFFYSLKIKNGEFILYVDSWSRIVGGSGQSHEITTEGCKLTNEGFV